MKFRQSFCVVDSSLRILWIGGDWDDFARLNDGIPVLANTILATKLTAHIVDETTAETIADMVFAVMRAQQPLRIDYRCDAPHEVRRFRLTIKPMKDGRAIMVHELRDAIRIEPPMQRWKFDPLARVQKCSICGFVQETNTWVDPSLPGHGHPEMVGYTTCADCSRQIEAAIRAVVEADGTAADTQKSFSSGRDAD